MVVVASATAANAWMMEPVLDDIFLNKDKTMLLIVPIAVFTITVIKGFAAYGQAVIMRFVGQRIVTDMQYQLYNHLLHADIGSLQEESSGKIISRFTNDINILRRSVSNVVTGFAKEIFTLVFLIGVMFYQSFTLSVIAFGAFPLAIYPIIRLGKRMRKVSHKTQEELGEFTNQLDETFQGIDVIKAYQRENFEAKRSKKILERLFDLYIKAARTEAATSPIMESLGGVAIAAVIWYGGLQVVEGNTSPGSFFSFITALIMAYKPMKSLSGLNTALQEGLASAKRLFILLDVQPTIVNKPKAVSLDKIDGNIELAKVHFSYNEEGKALDGVSLKVPKGKTVALVGPSGSGKSTIMNLILRFYDVADGQLLIDNHDIRDITLHSLRQHIAIVNQHVTLFDDTIAANIAYGKPGASQKEIEAAAKAAAADEFIKDLPQQYKTVIGQNGFALSGGQRQRLAIARAMLKNAPILLLDEATSALDSISEKKVQKALEKLMKGRTTIVIAHRLSTVENADKIFVLKKGKVIESGKHKTLLKKGGEYSNLHLGLEKT
jgi:subfamily B ATP-binding cassette protein MsbA